MITKQALVDNAKRQRLSPHIIEKDYVLSWLLAGISESETLQKDWIFKGGTCLKKCYFDSYRFSEDLDFTLTNHQHRNSDFLKELFLEISAWIYDLIGLELPENGIRFELFKNPRGEMSVQGKIAYKGPLQRKGSNPTVKLDLSWSEVLVENAVQKAIYHPYQDYPFQFKTQAYSLEEIFAEKLRALVERMRPRDLYDIVHIFHSEKYIADRPRILTILKQKCAYKAVPIPTLESIFAKPEKEDLNADWHSMLAHQIYQLEPPEEYWNKLRAILEWLNPAVD